MEPGRTSNRSAARSTLDNGTTALSVSAPRQRPSSFFHHLSDKIHLIPPSLSPRPIYTICTRLFQFSKSERLNRFRFTVRLTERTSRERVSRILLFPLDSREKRNSPVRWPRFLGWLRGESRRIKRIEAARKAAGAGNLDVPRGYYSRESAQKKPLSPSSSSNDSIRMDEQGLIRGGEEKKKKEKERKQRDLHARYDDEFNEDWSRIRERKWLAMEIETFSYDWPRPLLSLSFLPLEEP